MPALQGLVISKTARPPVPGPHHQDGAVEHPGCDRPLRMVWLGDSLASGVGADEADSSFPRKAAALYALADRRAVQLTCLARPGARAGDVLAEQVPVALGNLCPDSVAVITVGSNDVGSMTRPGRFRRDYDAIVTALTATGATVITCGLPDISAATVIPHPLRFLAGWVGRNADRHIQRIAAAHDAHFVGIDTHPPRGTKWHVYLAADRWHPNNDTYLLWAQRFADTLKAAVSLVPPLHPA